MAKSHQKESQAHLLYTIREVMLLERIAFGRKVLAFMEPFTLCVIYSARPGGRAAFLQEIEKSGVLDAIHAEEGCLKYAYCPSTGDTETLVLLEQWASHAHQQAHLKQPHMARLREIKEHYIETTQVGIVAFNDAQ